MQDQPSYTRFEAKYLVDPAIYPDIREFIRPFMELDRHAVHHPEHRYPICSLYLDSPDLLLYNQVLAGEKSRFKLRIRSYYDDPSAPVYVEVKKRHNVAVQKTRMKLEREQAMRLLSAELPMVPSELPPAVSGPLETFLGYKRVIGAQPLLRVRYRREAYEARTFEPVRITFDTELMHAATFDADFDYLPGNWVTTPVGKGIIEIKFTDRFPFWVQDLVQFFGLKQLSVPKYVMSVDEFLNGSRTETARSVGFALPPGRHAIVR